MRRWKSHLTGTRRVVAALALLIAVGAVAALVLGVGSSSPPGTASASSPPSGTTTVQRRDLVETDTESGTVSYAKPHTVYNRLSGTITWLPSVGQVITPGQALFRVAGKPIILMNGNTPAYRDLAPSDSDGQDILELNRNLVALGFNPGGIVADDAWQAATTDGVDALQASLGETETGALKLGSVVLLPGDQIVSTVTVPLGSQAALRGSALAPEFVGLTTSGTTPQSATAPQGTPKPKSHAKTQTTLPALLALLKAETAQLQAAAAQLQAAAAQLRAAQLDSTNPGNGAPRSIGGSPAPSNNSPRSGSGNGDGSATAILTTSSTELVVTVELDPSKQSEAKVGEPVTVEMPSGKSVNARVSAVSPVAQSSSSANNANGSGNGSGGEWQRQQRVGLVDDDPGDDHPQRPSVGRGPGPGVGLR